MSFPANPGDGEILVIGFGNSLRQDDAIGPTVAGEAEAWGDPRLRVLSLHQLTPEVAADLAACAVAIFVDASVVPGAGTVRVEKLELTPPESGLAHTIDPAHLLAVADALYGIRPDAYLITVPAVRLDIGEGLTPQAQAGVTAAVSEVRRLIEEYYTDA